jgi:hypothetical protein
MLTPQLDLVAVDPQRHVSQCPPPAAPRRRRARGIGFGQQGDELVAAEPGDEVDGIARDGVAGAQVVGEHSGHLAERLVAGRMSELVVDLLEAVEVDHQQRPAAAVAPRVGELPPQLLLEAPAVEEAGERIVL